MHGQAHNGENVMKEAFEAVLMGRHEKEKGMVETKASGRLEDDVFGARGSAGAATPIRKRLIKAKGSKKDEDESSSLSDVDSIQL